MKRAIEYRPVFRYALMLAWIGALLLVAAAWMGWWAFLVAIPVSYIARHVFRMQRQSDEELSELNLRAIEALAVVIEAKDDTTHRHIQRVSLYADAIAKELRLRQSERKALCIAAVLHDIGKVAVPEHIISKPGRLTEEEFEKMKIHTVVGAEILERVRFPYPVAPMVRSHHERWDGSGYPDSLKEDQIPIGARILAVVDSFDAISSDRNYRPALPPEEALKLIKEGAGTTYDPKVVQVLEKLFPQMSKLLEFRTPLESRLPARMRIENEAQTGPAAEKASETSWVLQSVVQARQELQILYELTQALGSSLSLQGTLKLMAERLWQLIPFDAMAVFLVRDGMLTASFVEGVHESLLARLHIPLGQGLAGCVAANGKHILNGNPGVEPGYEPDPRESVRLRSALLVPLESSGETIGALSLYSRNYEGFTVDHLRILKGVAAKAGPTVHNAVVHQEVGKSADTDELTGVANARALWARLDLELARAVRESTPLSVFVVDLNGLKRINDTQGHLTGNKVIQGIATALTAGVRSSDFLARLGGDEFVLILPRTDAEAAASRRLDLAMAVERLAGEFPEVEITISMGSATFPSDGKNREQLVSVADRRMYRHKRSYYERREGAVAGGRAH